MLKNVCILFFICSDYWTNIPKGWFTTHATVIRLLLNQMRQSWKIWVNRYINSLWTVQMDREHRLREIDVQSAKVKTQQNSLNSVCDPLYIRNSTSVISFSRIYQMDCRRVIYFDYTYGEFFSIKEIYCQICKPCHYDKLYKYLS